MAMTVRLVAGVALSISLLSGCDLDAIQRAVQQSAEKSKSSLPTMSVPAAKSPNAITVATFNIQVFGQSKLKDRAVCEVLAQVVRRFDVVAVQELRSKEQDVMPRFLELINADGARYDYAIGPRLGRTSSKEQYVFIYDTTRLEILPQSVYTVDDPLDLLHREPLVATFRVVGRAGGGEPFSFTLVNVHTDPDETDTELDALADMFVRVQQDRIGEDDVILLGDFNADERSYRRLGRLPAITTAVSGVPTNTRGTESYDNLVFDRRSTVEFSGQSGVLDLAQEFRLSSEAALAVSDHLPVWAAFSATEGSSHTLPPPRVTNRPHEHRH